MPQYNYCIRIDKCNDKKKIKNYYRNAEQKEIANYVL